MNKEVKNEEYNLAIAKKVVDVTRLKGFSTGFPPLDNLTKGLKRGSLLVFAGQTGMGKSLFTIQLLVNLAKSGQNVFYFDLENGKETSWQRIVQIWFKVKEEELQDKNIKRIAKAIDIIEKSGFSYWSKDDLREWAHNNEKSIKSLIVDIVKAQKDKKTVFLIDPLQVLENEAEGHELFQVQAKTIEELKDLAQELGIVIIICHHMRKGASDGQSINNLAKIKEASFRIPTLDDLRGSGKIGDTATEVWGMLRIASADTQEDRSKTLIRVLKNRHGRQGDAFVYFHEDYLGFTDKPQLEVGNGKFEIK